MFIKESLRLYPAVPYVARSLDKPIEIPKSETCKVTIPKNANVNVAIMLTHRNPLLWEDPEVSLI